MTQTDTQDAIIGFEAGTYPYSDRLKRDDYEQQKAALQAELLKVRFGPQKLINDLSFCSKAVMRLAKAAQSNGSLSI